MINPTEEDIGRAVIYKSFYGDIEEEGKLSSVGTHVIYVRFSDRGIPIACPRACLYWKEEKEEKEEDPCPSKNPLMASASTATLPAAPKSGSPLASELGQNVLNSLTSGTEQKPKDGEPALQEESIRKGIRNGLIDAQAAAFKFPPVNVNRRPEVAAFIEGYCLCFKGLASMFNPDETLNLMRKVGQLALELYPNHDPTPDPVKRAEDGRRRDGIIMEK